MRSPKSSNQPARGTKTRGRTNLTSYYRSANEAGKSSPFQPKSSKRSSRKLLFGAIDAILAVVLIVGLVSSLLLNSSPQVKANSQIYHSLKDYQAQITPLLGAVQNRNKLTFDEAGVVGQIEKKFPEVQSARVELPFFSEQPVVWLNISPPALSLSNPSGSYAVDTQGVAAGRQSQLPGLKNLIPVTDQTGYYSEVGRQVLSSQSVGFIIDVAAQSRAAGIKITSLTLPALAQELDLRAAGQSYYVKFYMGGDAKLQSGQYLAARHQFAKEGQGPTEYLDVRVPGKIFYK